MIIHLTKAEVRRKVRAMMMANHVRTRVEVRIEAAHTISIVASAMGEAAEKKKDGR